VKILNRCDTFSKILSSNLLAKSTFLFEHGVYLTLCTVLKDKVKIVVILVVIVQLENMTVIKLVHNFDF